MAEPDAHDRARDDPVGASTQLPAWSAGAVAVAIYAAVIMLTRPLDLGDTIFYVDPILDMARRPSPAAFRAMLDFGHLLWRPLGWLAFDALRAGAPGGALGPDRMVAVRALIDISIAAGALATLLLYSISERLGVRPVVSITVAATFVVCNAVVNTAQAGSSYMLGLALLMAALRVLLGPASAATGNQRGQWTAGVLLALAAATWFPFVLAVPAAAVVAALPWSRRTPTDGRGFRPSGAARTLAAAALAGVLLFGAAAWLLGIRSPEAALAWVRESGHGWRQRSNLLRLGMGLPRCCVALGDAGVLWKRYLFRDPFAPVSTADLVRGSIGSIALMGAFYAALAGLLWTLARLRAWRVLVILSVAAAPVLAFAVVLFEPSSIERYLPAFPFLFVAVAYALDAAWARRRARTLALAFPAVIVLSTAVAYDARGVERHWAPALTRLEALARGAAAGSTVTLLDNQDIVDLFIRNDPLRDTLSSSFEFWVALRPANERIFCWRELFAARAVAAWDRAREVWVSDRLRAPSPHPDWNWIEGDDRAIRWRDIPAFFATLEFDRHIGGSGDGFARLPGSDANRRVLQPLVSGVCGG